MRPVRRIASSCRTCRSFCRPTEIADRPDRMIDDGNLGFVARLDIRGKSGFGAESMEEDMRSVAQVTASTACGLTEKRVYAGSGPGVFGGRLSARVVVAARDAENGSYFCGCLESVCDDSKGSLHPTSVVPSNTASAMWRRRLGVDCARVFVTVQARRGFGGGWETPVRQRVLASAPQQIRRA